MGLSLDTINELAKVGGIAALFGLGMWLVYSLAIEGIRLMAAIEERRTDLSKAQADALLEHAKRDEQNLKLSRDIEELRILSQRLLQIVERRYGGGDPNG